MSQATWRFAITNPDTGKILDFLDCPTDCLYTRRLDEYCELEGNIVNPSDFKEAHAFYRSILATRDGVPRFYGRIVDPFKRMPRQRVFLAKDPFHIFEWRRVRSDVTLTDQPDDIAWSLMSLQNGYRDTGIRAGADHAWGASVARKFKAGDTVAEKVKFLGQTHGERFHFKVNASHESGSARMAYFNTFSSSANKPGARFEYGAGTMQNCSDFDVESGQVINRATSIGQKGSCDSTGESTKTNQNAGSIEQYNLWEDERGHTRTDDADQLDGVSHAMLDIIPPRQITMTPLPTAPALFDDFDVGDHVQVRIIDYDFTLTAVCLVTEVQLSIDPDSTQEVIELIHMTEVP